MIPAEMEGMVVMDGMDVINEGQEAFSTPTITQT
jgi:hypothetical protein